MCFSDPCPSAQMSQIYPQWTYSSLVLSENLLAHACRKIFFKINTIVISWSRWDLSHPLSGKPACFGPKELSSYSRFSTSLSFTTQPIILLWIVLLRISSHFENLPALASSLKFLAAGSYIWYTRGTSINVLYIAVACAPKNLQINKNILASKALLHYCLRQNMWL